MRLQKPLKHDCTEYPLNAHRQQQSAWTQLGFAVRQQQQQQQQSARKRLGDGVRPQQPSPSPSKSNANTTLSLLPAEPPAAVEEAARTPDGCICGWDMACLCRLQVEVEAC